MADTRLRSMVAQVDVAAWIITVIFASSFVALGLVTHGPNTLQIDQSVSAWVQGFSGSLATGVASFGDQLGTSTGAVVFLIVLSTILAITQRHRELRFMVFVLLGRFIATRLKDVFDSPRPGPDEVSIAGTFDHLGFPSGHVTTATVTLGALFMIVAYRFDDRAIRTVAGGIWVVGVLMTAWARIWYGAHWFTDTVGGALAGMTIVLAAAAGSRMSEDVWPRRRVDVAPAR